MVECSQSGSIGSGRSFKCEFCYNFGRSCQSSLTCMDVIPGSGSATLLPSSLAEGTYCYRATAIVDGIPARMIQDTFSIRSPCSNTGVIYIKNIHSHYCSIDKQISDRIQYLEITYYFPMILSTFSKNNRDNTRHFLLIGYLNL